MKWHARVAIMVLIAFTIGQIPTVAFAKPAKDGKIVILSTTLGAEIRINGETKGIVPFEEPISLPQGEHEILLLKRGYADYVQMVNVKSGKTTELEIELIAIDGIVRVVTPGIEDAAVRVDGQIVGSTPFDGLVPAGVHTITISKPGYDEVALVDQPIRAGMDHDFSVPLAAVEVVPTAELPTEPIPAASSTEWYESWWFWTIVGGVAAAGIGVGTYYGLSNQSEDHQADLLIRPFGQ